MRKTFDAIMLAKEIEVDFAVVDKPFEVGGAQVPTMRQKIAQVAGALKEHTLKCMYFSFL